MESARPSPQSKRRGALSRSSVTLNPVAAVDPASALRSRSAAFTCVDVGIRRLMNGVSRKFSSRCSLTFTTRASRNPIVSPSPYGSSETSAVGESEIPRHAPPTRPAEKLLPQRPLQHVAAHFQLHRPARNRARSEQKQHARRSSPAYCHKSILPPQAATRPTLIYQTTPMWKSRTHTIRVKLLF